MARTKTEIVFFFKQTELFFIYNFKHILFLTAISNVYCYFYYYKLYEIAS